MNILELIIFIVFILLFFTMTSLAVKFKIDTVKLRKDVDQGIADQFALTQKIEDAYKNTDTKKIEETEGFLKFVSQSRDWAFQYIERVQISIKNFQDVFHPLAEEYYKDKDKPINQEEFGKLFEAYKKLIEELPDEGKSK
jgi:hypothetical protein